MELQLLNTAELVLSAQAGDRAAFGELVRRFQAPVYAAALEKLREASEAQELAHEAFVRAFTKLDQLRQPAAFPGWVRQIAVRLALNRLSRRKKLNQAEDSVLENAKAAGPSPLDNLLRAEDRLKVQRGLAGLRRLDQEVLIAFYIRGESIKDISEQLEAPEGTIKRRLHVARNRLKALLEGQVEASVAPAPVEAKPLRLRAASRGYDMVLA
jgi:RNA polymerase sigma-70 factor (ECF subfamily)